MTLSANQSAMAFQKAQDQKIDQHQQPEVELGNKVKIHCDDTTVRLYLVWSRWCAKRTQVHSFMNDVTALD